MLDAMASAVRSGADEFIAAGKLQHDFAMIIARKKTTFRTWVRFYSNRVRRSFISGAEDS